MEELTKKAQKAKETAAAQGTKSKQPPKPREQFGNTAQPNIEHQERLFELDDADLVCPSCGGQLEPMKGQFETSEMIDVIEVSYKLVNVKQQKYHCQCGDCVETALGPERATSGGRYSLDFAIKVVVDKYEDHIPLARQQRILRRHGVTITTQALWDPQAEHFRNTATPRRVQSAIMSRCHMLPVIASR
jgi:transposase